MNRDEIIRVAREAEIVDSHGYIIANELAHLERFAALVAAAEREACAKFFDDNDTNMFWGSQAAQHIRARGETK